MTQQETPPPKISDTFFFLLGNKQAIQRLAHSHHTIAIAALLVITAGLARNYDHYDLTSQWQWIYGPYIASLITSVIIYICGCTRHFVKKSIPYITFLSLYWMTSPCAWLYAFPIEALTDIVTATRWNIAFLAIVSIWRILLVSRFISVLSGEKFFISLIGVAWPASAIMCVASLNKGIELVGIMGGIELSEHEIILRDAANFTTSFCFFIAILTTLIHLIIFIRHKYNPTQLKPLIKSKTLLSSTPKKLYLFTSIILTISLIIAASLPFQQQIKNNNTITQLSNKEEYKAAVIHASALKRNNFLIHHEFPPGKNLNFQGYSKNIPLLMNTTAKTPKWLINEWLKNVIPKKKINRTHDQIEKIFSKHKTSTLSPHQLNIKKKIISQLTAEETTPPKE